MKLPEGELFILYNDGSKESIAITDITSKDEFIKEVNYLINNYFNGYKNSAKAIEYVKNNQVIHYISTKELFMKEGN